MCTNAVADPEIERSSGQIYTRAQAICLASLVVDWWSTHDNSLPIHGLLPLRCDQYVHLPISTCTNRLATEYMQAKNSGHMHSATPPDTYMHATKRCDARTDSCRLMYGDGSPSTCPGSPGPGSAGASMDSGRLLKREAWAVCQCNG